MSSGSGRRSSVSTAPACTRRSRSACGATARSCSTARSAGHAASARRRAEGEEKVPNTPETPHVIFSASKAITAAVVHLLDQQGKLHIGDRVAEYIPEYARHGKDAITIAHILSHKGGVPNLPAEILDLEQRRQPRADRRGPLRRQAAVAAGHFARLSRDLGRLHPRRGRPPGDGQADRRGARRRDPRPARLPLDQLRGRSPRTSARSRTRTRPVRRVSRRSRTCSSGRSGSRSARSPSSRTRPSS